MTTSSSDADGFLASVWLPALVATGLSKTFAGVRVLADIDLAVQAGEVHALLGENGSGKSTLIKILSGYHRPDEGGQIVIGGHRQELGVAQAAYSLGCRFVHQDLGLVDSESVLDNLSFTAGFPTRGGTIRSGVAQQQARLALARVGLKVDLRARVGVLSQARRTGVALARALREDAGSPVRLLVLDEPSATLPEQEVERLLTMVRAVAAAGIGVLYVTHRLDEVFQLAQRVTVLRDGHKVATQAVSSLTPSALVSLLIGADVDDVHVGSAPPDRPDNVLRVDDLHGEDVNGVSFTASPGEIVGIAGITGSGRETALGAIFGSVDRWAGTVSVDGQVLEPLRPDQAIRNGVAFLPAERPLRGGVMSLSARENLSLPSLSPFWKWPALRRSSETEVTRWWFKKLDVRPAVGLERPLSTFSGGNQQKLLFAKWLRLRPKILLLDEPTQGVDIGAKVQLHREVLAAAAEGVAVVVSSSDAEELVALCHRVLVLRKGRMAADLRGAALNNHNVVHESVHGDERSLADEGSVAHEA